MARAFVAVGSNIKPAVNVRAAIRALAERAHVMAVSTVYCTEPEGPPGQPPFYNCIVELSTGIPAHELKFQVLRRIESELGRQRTSDKYAARTIDLDLVLYDDLILNAEGLVLPDPDIAVRSFLAVPLSELAPDLTLPGTAARIAELAAALPTDKMRPLRSYTAHLKRQVLEKQTGSQD